MESLPISVPAGEPPVDQFDTGHLPGAMHLPRGQLELRVHEAFADPTVRIVTVSDFGKISTLAAATLRALGFARERWRSGRRPAVRLAWTLPFSHS